MTQARGERELAQEYLPGGLGALKLRIEDLQRDLGLAHLVTRAPYLAVPAGAEFFYEHEAAAQLCAGLVLICHLGLGGDLLIPTSSKGACWLRSPWWSRAPGPASAAEPRPRPSPRDRVV